MTLARTSARPGVPPGSARRSQDWLDALDFRRISSSRGGHRGGYTAPTERTPGAARARARRTWPRASPAHCQADSAPPDDRLAGRLDAGDRVGHPGASHAARDAAGDPGARHQHRSTRPPARAALVRRSPRRRPGAGAVGCGGARRRHGSRCCARFLPGWRRGSATDPVRRQLRTDRHRTMAQVPQRIETGQDRHRGRGRHRHAGAARRARRTPAIR